MLGSSNENGRLFGSMRPKNPATTVIAINTIQSKAYDANSFTEKLRLDEPPEWAILWYSDIRRHPALDECRGEKKRNEAKKRREGKGCAFP